MQQITDLRRQTAAAAQEPMGLSSWWDRVWADQVGVITHEVFDLSQKLDVSLHTHIQDVFPGSATFGQMHGGFMSSTGLPDPFWSGPI